MTEKEHNQGDEGPGILWPHWQDFNLTKTSTANSQSLQPLETAVTKDPSCG